MEQNKISQEHLGLAKVHRTCAEMNAIWRATPSSDLGIDGQIEFLEPDSIVSTGHLIGVQVKSGPSYFTHKRGDAFAYYPSDTHRRYWRQLVIPVILVLHSPDNDQTIYARIKPQLLLSDGPIYVSSNDRFDSQARGKLLEAASADLIITPPGEVIADFKQIRCAVGDGREISGVHFLLASVHPQLRYFEIRMCRLVAMLATVNHQSGALIGPDIHEYLFRCILKLWKNQLTQPFFGAFELTWYELQMVPDIALPLTPWGLSVFEHLWTRLDSYLELDSTSDDAVELGRKISAMAQLASERLDASDRLGETPR